MQKVVSNLNKLINEDANEQAIAAVENILIESIDLIVNEECFYSLPTKNILQIIGKSEIEDEEATAKIVSNMSKYKGEEAPLILNVIKADDMHFNDCISIISSLGQCPLCRRIGELYIKESNLPEISQKVKFSP